jgi:Putative adhesin
VRIAVLLLLLCILAACSSAAPYVTTVGILKPGATLAVRTASGTVNAYQPAAGQPRDLFTIAATALPKSSPAPPKLRPMPHGVLVSASQPLSSLLVRVPDGVTLDIDSSKGDINVTDIPGSARVVAERGNVNVMLPGYAQAATGEGNVSVTMGAATWPGTLRFSTRRGDIVLRISAKAAFGVHLHTGSGVLFTDFGLRGTSSGGAETIDGSVNGGTTQRIDVETSSGAIRLLRLQPQP